MIVNAYLQARVSSTRLPAKVLKTLCGKSMLEHQIDRLKLSKSIDNIVVLTSIDESDDAIQHLCDINKINCFRGDLDNVLSRFSDATIIYPCDHIVRITGDCPLLDWDLVDYIVSEHIKKGVDYTSNTIDPTYPDGLDVEVIKQEILLDAAIKSVKKFEKEHVTYSIYNNRNVYSLYNVINPLGDESHMRWTVDELVDFEFISSIYKYLYVDKPFSTNKVRELLIKNPKLNSINSGIKRNLGLMKSLKESH